MMDVSGTKLLVPHCITLIANRAFQGFKMLVSVAIPATVSKIGANAFTGCKQLESVTILSQAAGSSSAVDDVGGVVIGNAAFA